jgi:hypothetical protein
MGGGTFSSFFVFQIFAVVLLLFLFNSTTRFNAAETAEVVARACEARRSTPPAEKNE